MEDAISRKEHDEFVRRMQDEHKRIHYRISDNEKKIDTVMELTRSVERLAPNMENMAKEQKEQGERLEVLEGRDGEMWRKATGYIVTAIAGIVVGFIFTQIGM